MPPGRRGRAAAGTRRAAAGAMSIAFAFLLGAATVLGFAPFELPGLPLLALALLLLLWQDATPRRAAQLGFAFGLGLFGAGVSWVYIALNTFGGMPLPLAARGDRGVLRVPRALSRRLAGLARDALHRRRVRGRARSPRRRLDARRVGAQLRASPASPGCRWATRRSCATGATPLAGFAPLGGRVRGHARGRARLGRARRSPIPAIAAGAWRRVGSAAAIAALVPARRRARRPRSSGRGGRSRSPSRWCRATSRRTSSSTRGFARTPSISMPSSSPSAAAGSSCCRRARSRCSPTRCPTGAAAPLAHCRRAQRRRAGGPVHRRTTASRRRACATTTACCRWAPSDLQLYRKRHLVPVRRDDSLRRGAGLVHPQRAVDPARQPDRGRRPTSRRCGSPASRWRSTSATRTRSARTSAPRPRPRRCWST